VEDPGNDRWSLGASRPLPLKKASQLSRHREHATFAILCAADVNAGNSRWARFLGTQSSATAAVSGPDVMSGRQGNGNFGVPLKGASRRSASLSRKNLTISSRVRPARTW
jgi:hypothetical protein